MITMTIHTNTDYVIIDDFKNELGAFFQAKGYLCIHIKSDSSLPNTYKFKEFDLIKVLTYDAAKKDTFFTELKSDYKIKCVIAFGESGIPLADEMNAYFGLRGNNPNLSYARRDKYFMAETVAKHGIRTVPHIKSSSVDDILTWAEQQPKNQYPLVLKPLSSKNSDNVFFCRTEEEIKKAFAIISSSQDLFGQSNQEVLAQTYNKGEEYIVNTVSCFGEHYPSEVLRVKRIAPDSIIYDYAEIVHSNDPIFDSLVEYTKKVLSAVGVENGPATTELKYDPKSKTVTLLETASRPMSNAPKLLIEEACGHSQAGLTVESCLQPNIFLKQIEIASSYQHAMIVVLQSKVEGILQQELDITEIASLKTYNGSNIGVAQGSKIDITTNPSTAPGEIYLMGTNRAALIADLAQIREFEKTLYQNALNPMLKSPSLTELVAAANSPVFFSLPPARGSVSVPLPCMLSA